MADTSKLHIALQSARELEIEVPDDAAAVRASLDSALAAGDALLWVEDVRGHEYAIVLDKLAFIEIEGERAHSSVGFGGL